MNRLKDKTVLITGATAGIGKATALEFAAQGAHVVLTGRRAERLEDLCDQIESTYNVDARMGAFDIQNTRQIHQFLRSLDMDIDILVNNAGMASGVDPIFDLKEDDWNVMIDTNVKGLLAMSQKVSEQMRKRNEGHIINLGSIAGHESYAGGVVYTATKHAVKAITEATKKDLHGTKVRVSMVSPGLVETEFSEVRFAGDKERAANVYKGLEALTAQDIAEIVVFIANRPQHVNIMDAIVFSVDQSSSTMVHRDV